MEREERSRWQRVFFSAQPFFPKCSLECYVVWSIEKHRYTPRKKSISQADAELPCLGYEDRVSLFAHDAQCS